jgi:hypothetical protein
MAWPGVPSREVTEALLKLLFKKGFRYERVTIETRGQNVYAWPSAGKWKKRTSSWGLPLWDSIRELSEDPRFKHLHPKEYGFMGCGNGGMTRGDQAQWNSQYVLLQPGVYLKNQTTRFPTEEDYIAARAEERFGERSIFEEDGLLLPCPHGTRKTCKENCFDKWGKWP